MKGEFTQLLHDRKLVWTDGLHASLLPFQSASLSPDPSPAVSFGPPRAICGRFNKTPLRCVFSATDDVSLQTTRAHMSPSNDTVPRSQTTRKSLTFKGAGTAWGPQISVSTSIDRTALNKRAHWQASSRFLFLCSSLFLRWKLYLWPHVCFSLRVGVWRSGQFYAIRKI